MTSSDAAAYMPDLDSTSAPETPKININPSDHPYGAIITTLDQLQHYLSVGKAGLGIEGRAVLVSLTDEAREEARKHADARVAEELRRRGLPEDTPIEELRKIIDKEHAAKAGEFRKYLDRRFGKTALETN